MTNVNQDDQPNVDNQDNSPESSSVSSGTSGSGLPLRGFAMVLIAVAVILGLWGLYALTQGGEDTTASNGDASVTAEGDAEGQASPEGAEGEAPAENAESAGQGSEDSEGSEASGSSGGSEGAESEDAAGSDAADGADAAGATGAAGAAEARAADGATGSGSNGASTSDAATARPQVNVLNNSTISGLAESVYNDLEDRGNDMGVHGNLADEVVILQETTVYYEAGDAAGEAAATELAEEIADTNGVSVSTETNIEGLPDDVTGEGSITLALIGEVIIP